MELSTTLQMSARLRLLLTIVAILAGIQYLLLPLTEWQRRTVERAIALQETLARKKIFTNSDTKLSDAYLHNVRLRDTLRAYFPAGSPDPQNLQLSLQQRVEKWAGECGVRVLKVDWLPVVKEAVVRAPVRFRIEASPAGLMQLLYIVETAPLLNTVDGMRLTASGGKSPYMSGELDLCAYGIAEEPRP